MMDDFETTEIQTGESSIFARWSGSGSTILLLHGFPQTHLMWRSVAPMLARNFTVVCPDLRGYGRSGCPASTQDHAPYAKRAMAQDMVIVMERLDRYVLDQFLARTFSQPDKPKAALDDSDARAALEDARQALRACERHHHRGQSLVAGRDADHAFAARE